MGPIVVALAYTSAGKVLNRLNSHGGAQFKEAHEGADCSKLHRVAHPARGALDVVNTARAAPDWAEYLFGARNGWAATWTKC